MHNANPLLNLLMVEDSAADIRLMLEAIKAADLSDMINVCYQNAATKAFEHLDAMYEDGTIFDMILLDLNMPEMTGKEFLARIKGNERYKHIPVFVMTISDYPVDIKDCHELGADAYFQKPTNFERLIDFFTAVKCSIDHNKKVTVSRITQRYEGLNAVA